MATRIYVIIEMFPCTWCKKRKVSRAESICARCAYDKKTQAAKIPNDENLPVYSKVYGRLDTVVAEDFFDVGDAVQGEYLTCD